MKRNAYAGTAGVTGGSSGGLATQTEAAAYFNRMSTPPSAAWKESVNRAVYQWKAKGSWSYIKGLWLFCAETQQAALLSVNGDTPRNATLTGTPTFTASKGFTGLSSANVVNLGGITATILADNNFAVVYAGKTSGSTTQNFIISDAAATYAPGHMQSSGASGVIRSPGIGQGIGFTGSSFIGGERAGCGLSPGGVSAFSQTPATTSDNFRTAASDAIALTQFTAAAFIGSGASALACKNFAATLAGLLTELGALD